MLVLTITFSICFYFLKIKFDLKNNISSLLCINYNSRVNEDINMKFSLKLGLGAKYVKTIEFDEVSSI